MIKWGGTDPFTKRARVIVECDHPGCDVSEFAPEDFGTTNAAEVYPEFGWQIDRGPHRRMGDPAPREFHALCPEHATRAPEPCTHPEKLRETPEYRNREDTLCGRCGAHVPPKPLPPEAVRVAALQAMLKRPMPMAEEGT